MDASFDDIHTEREFETRKGHHILCGPTEDSMQLEGHFVEDGFEGVGAALFQRAMGELFALLLCFDTCLHTLRSTFDCLNQPAMKLQATKSLCSPHR